MKSILSPKSNYITLTVLYFEIESHNRKYHEYKITKREKVCLAFLGWEQMNGRRVKRDRFLKNKFSDRVVQGLIIKGLIDHNFKPIKEGRRFYYELIHNICLFFMKYVKHGLSKTPQSISVDINEIKTIILK